MEAKIVFNYSKLKGRIKEKVGTQSSFAKGMNMSDVSISDKLNNKKQWSQNEMIAASEVLDFSISEIPVYFFTQEIKEA